MTGTQSGSPIKIFFSYAHEDKELREKIEKHLTLYRRQRILTIWFDRAIQAGVDWKHEIDTQINTADIILLLISADFIASDYCYGIEMRTALERHRSGSARVIPIILRSVVWQGAPFSGLKVLPTDGKPIISSHWHDPDHALQDVARGVYQVVEKLLERRSKKHASTQRLSSTRQRSIRTSRAQSSININSLKQDMQEEEDLLLEEYTLPPHRYAARIKRNQLLAQKRLSKTSDWKIEGEGDEEALPPIKRMAERVLPAKIVSDEEDEELLPNTSAPRALSLITSRSINSDIQKKKEQLIKEGDAHYNMKGYEAALVAYEEAITLDTNDANLYNNKGNALYNLERAREALVAYNRAIQLDPSIDFYHSNKANVFFYLLDGCSEDAVVAYDQAIQRNSGNIDHYLNKANILLSLEDYNQALAVYNQVIQLNPDNIDYYFLKVNVHFLSENYDQAIIECDQILQIDTDNPDAYLKKSAALLHLDHPFHALYTYLLAISSKGLQKIRVLFSHHFAEA